MAISHALERAMNYPLSTLLTVSRGHAAAGGGGGFSGLLDGLTAAPTYAGSVYRRLTSTSWGTIDTVLDPLIMLRRGSDNADKAFSYVAETNILDTAAIATWLGAATGYIAKLYDQSGNGDHLLQIVDAKQPTFGAALVNGLPGMDHALAGGVFSKVGGSTTYTAAVSVFVACHSQTTPTTSPNTTLLAISDDATILWSHSSGVFRGSASIKNAAEAWVNVDMPGLVGATDYVLGFLFDATDMVPYIDGVAQTSATAVALDAGTMVALGSGCSGEVPDCGPWDGETSELLVWDLLLAAGDIATVNDDMKGVYLP